MNYKKILNNKLLILIDKGFRLLGFYTILVVDNKKIVNVKFEKNISGIFISKKYK